MKKHRSGQWILLSVIVMFSPINIYGEIYKCVSQDKRVFYNDKPCPAADEETQMKPVKDPVVGYFPEGLPAYGQVDAQGYNFQQNADVAKTSFENNKGGRISPKQVSSSDANMSGKAVAASGKRTDNTRTTDYSADSGTEHPPLSNSKPPGDTDRPHVMQ